MQFDFSFAAERRFGSADYRRWVIAGALVAALGYSGSNVAAMLTYGLVTPQQLVATAVCWVAVSLAIMQRPSLAATLVLLAVWSEVNYGILIADEFPPVGLVVTPAFVAGAGLLLGALPSLGIALLSIAIATPVVLHSKAALHEEHSRLVYWLVIHALSSLSTWAVVAIGLSALERVLNSVRAKETELADTIRLAPDGILVVDGDDRLLTVNPAARRILGIGDAEYVGTPLGDVLRRVGAGTELSDLLHDGNSAEAPLALSVSHGGGERTFVEVTWRRTTGDRRQVSLRDVTERVRAEDVRRGMEEELAHARRLEAIGQLAGGIAHDFNNLLTAVAGSAELLRDDLGNETHAGLLDEIMAAQERGTALTKQLLSFARRDMVQAKVFDLSAQVTALQRLLQRIAGEQVQVICDVEPDCRVRADVGQIEQALVNLVTNARDAMPAGGPCTLRCRRVTAADGGRWVELSVSDRGIGMEEEARAHAFEPFFTTKPRGRGTGLGLASVHGIVMQSGGRARLESAPRRGTTVSLEFPFAEESVEIAAAAPVMPERVHGGATILVAEDDDGTRGVIDRILQRAGYRVLLAPDGVAAMRLADKHGHALDLLLSDVMMPGLSGPQLASRLRAREPALPVVFMSGYPEDALGNMPDLVLERDFIAKPFSSALLLQRVHDALQRRGARASAPRPAP